ncbi:MAG: rhodanese-like domain-containing protein, partial [Endomicrobiales bacterium]
MKWVSTGWLEEHLNSREFMILDAQPNIHDYLEEHLPGAVYVNEEVFRASIDGMPGRYAPLESVRSVTRCLGLKHDIPAVVYTGRG